MSEFATSCAVEAQAFAVQVGRAEKEPSLWQVTEPDPEYPALQVTETTAPVQGLVVDDHDFIGVLDQLVDGQSGVVGLNDSIGHLGRHHELR